MTATACRRSNVVGTSSPTSAPRCPSRHCTASGERERPRLATIEMRRRTPHRLLREALAEGTTPSAQRRPHAAARARDRPGTDAAPDLAHWLTNDEPQRQRERDGGVAVVPTRGHAARHHEKDHAARRAAVATAHDDKRRRRCIWTDRTSNLPLPHAVSVQPKSATRRATRRAAGTGRRTRGRDRGRGCKPVLDVEGEMNDS